MKRVSFILMIALAASTAPAIAQQTTTQARRPDLCYDAHGKAFSRGFVVQGADGISLRCAAPEWEPVPNTPAPTPRATSQSAQGSSQGSGQGSAQGTPRPGSNPGAIALASVENVRLELVINDQSGGSPAVRKVMTLLLAERAQGRVRSGGEYFRAGTEGVQGPSYVPVTLNADAYVTAIAGDRIRVSVTVEYMPAMSGAESAHRRNQLNQSVDVVLTSGKPILIVESADPISDRKVSLTATATIVR